MPTNRELFLAELINQYKEMQIFAPTEYASLAAYCSVRGASPHKLAALKLKGLKLIGRPSADVTPTEVVCKACDALGIAATYNAISDFLAEEL